MLNQLRWRIAIPYIILIVILMGVIAAYLSNAVRQNELDQLNNKAGSDAHLIGNFLAQRGGDILTDDIEIDRLAKEWSQLIDARVTIIDTDGIVLGESHGDRTTMDNHLDRPEIQQAMSEGIGRSVRFSRTEGIEFMYVAVPIGNADRIIGFSRIAIPVSRIEADLSLINRTFLFAAVIAALLAILIAAIIAELLSRPIRNLTNAIQQVTIEDIDLDLTPTTENEIGQLTRAFYTAFDYLKAQFNELEVERLKLQTVLNQLSDSIVIVDHEGLIQLTNPATEEMFDTDMDEAAGQSIVKILREHQIVSLWQSADQNRSQESMDIELRTKNLALLAHAIPLDDPFPGSTMLVFQDVTHIRHLENIRRDFISNISHELRTPLASLKALTETLQSGALEDPQVSHHFLERMEIEVDALALMVQELLELSRIESGRVPLELETVDPCDLLKASIERLRLQVETSGLDLSLDCADEIPHVLADKNRMEQVLVNLLHNAIKFTTSGGKIAVACREQGDQVLFSIADTGEGIPPGDLPRIFERFYKTDRSRSGGGTGLGLAISKHLVEAHEGHIWAESDVGQGSTFYFTVPIFPD